MLAPARSVRGMVRLRPDLVIQKLLHVVPDQPERFAEAATGVDQEDAQTVAVLAAAAHRLEQPVLFLVVEEADSPGTLLLSPELRQAVNVPHFMRLSQQFAERRHLAVDGRVAIAAFA